MSFIRSKSVQVISNGSVVFSLENSVNEKQFRINEKDYKNCFLFEKKQNLNFKKFDSQSNYKNQYIF